MRYEDNGTATHRPTQHTSNDCAQVVMDHLNSAADCLSDMLEVEGEEGDARGLVCGCHTNKKGDCQIAINNDTATVTGLPADNYRYLWIKKDKLRAGIPSASPHIFFKKGVASSSCISRGSYTGSFSILLAPRNQFYGMHMQYMYLSARV